MSWRWDETLFAGAAPHYTAGRLPYPDELAPAIANALDLDGTGTLLDVGCGPGSLALPLADRYARVIGLDPDPGMLREAERLAAAAHPPITNVRWLQARAEELPRHDLGPITTATFGASFHWMDQPLVARLVHERLAVRRGAFVHVGPDVTHDFQDDLPQADIDALIARYLGPLRRAGQGVRVTSQDGEEDVLAALPFEGPTRLLVPRPPLVRTTDQVVSYVLSMSYAAPHLFGDRLADFEADLRALLAHQATYRFDHGGVVVRIWRKRSGNTSPMANDHTAADDEARTKAQELILEESDERQEDREAAPDSFVEHRTSDEATPPIGT
jgi:SAM-dependent methyltransferase